MRSSADLAEDARTYRFAEFTLWREQAMRIARTKGWKPDNPREQQTNPHT